MKNKIILMILNQGFLPDIRVEQEYDALVEAGYRVIVVASKKGIQTDKYEIIRIDLSKGLSRYFSLTFSFNPIMKKQIISALDNMGVKSIDAIHVHDLPWAFIGVQLKKYYKSKLIIDFHEPYVEIIRQIEDYNKQQIIPIKHYVKVFFMTFIKPSNEYFYNILFNYAYKTSKFSKYEKKIVKECDAYIVVVEEAFDKFDKKYWNKGIVVLNSKDPNKWALKELPPLEEKLIVAYIGTVQEIRGIDTVIKAMKYVDQNKFQINIVGVLKDTKIYMEFVNLIKSLSLTNVNLIPFEKDEQIVFSYIDKAHIGIVPHKNTKLTQEALPHKMFMYMSKGRPVLVSNMAPLERMVKYSNNGYVFKSENPKDLADKLNILYNNKDYLNEMALNGRKAILEKYNWNEDKKRLLEMYSKLI